MSESSPPSPASIAMAAAAESPAATATTNSAPAAADAGQGGGAKQTGTVKWFNSSKGFGFITPEGGGEDLFVHQTSIHAQGFRSLQQGEPVEYVVEVGEDGRMRALEVTGPDGAFVQGAPRYSAAARAATAAAPGVGMGGGGVAAVAAPSPPLRFGGVCYNCGMVGHMSRNCTAAIAYAVTAPPVALFPRGRGRGRGGGGRGGGARVGPITTPSQADPRSCYNCGAVGHLQRDCPNLAAT